MNMYQTITRENKRYSLYDVRRREYKKDSDELPFRVSPSPLCITDDQQKELRKLGYAVCHYVKVIMQLYQNDEEIRRILNKGKADIFLNSQNPQYLFLRPDLIVTENGFKICELETSIFGLALSDILNRCYIQNGYQTIVEEDILKKYINSQIPNYGDIAYSRRVQAFHGQLEYLANEIFSNQDKKWQTKLIENETYFSNNIYRAFYSEECLSDCAMNHAIKNCVPSLTPQFEEKALLAFIWDTRFCNDIQKKLGDVEYTCLRTAIPPTCILGEEKYFDADIPELTSMAKLPKSQRNFVLKKSGDSAWGEGITFLHKISHEKVKKAIENAYQANDLYIIQYFTEGKKIQMQYFLKNDIQTMQAKVRITPYYAFCGQDFGKLISIKATGCENTDYIHGATNSINTSIRC